MALILPFFCGPTHLLGNPPVDAINEERQLAGREDDLSADLTDLWPDETALIQPLAEEAHPIAVPVEDLDQVRPPPREANR